MRRSLDGEAFLGRLWIFFLGGRGRGRGLTRASTTESLSQETSGFKQTHFLCYILYIEQWGFHNSMCQTIVNGPPILDALGNMHCSSWDSSTTLFHTLKTVKSLLHLVPSRTPRSSGYGVLCTCVYVTCYFCYMYSLG